MKILAMVLLSGLAGWCEPPHDGVAKSPVPLEPPQSPVDDEDARIEALVLQLRSPVQAPHPDFYFPEPMETLRHLGDFEDPSVAAATQMLIAAGPRAYKVLTRHRDDRDYCYSTISATWLNHSVGARVMEIMTHDLAPCGAGYEPAKVEERVTRTGSQRRPMPDEYLAERGFDTWVAESSRLSRSEVRRKFLGWYVEAEKQRGFKDAVQEQEVLNGCRAELQSLSK